MDEEGYSIRPEDAATISRFPDEPEQVQREGSDSDSDFEDGELVEKLFAVLDLVSVRPHQGDSGFIQIWEPKTSHYMPSLSLI